VKMRPDGLLEQVSGEKAVVPFVVQNPIRIPPLPETSCERNCPETLRREAGGSIAELESESQKGKFRLTLI